MDQSWVREMVAEHEGRLQWARLSLLGLSVGDALGEHCFGAQNTPWLKERRTPPGPWVFTDDTVMGISITDTLAEKWKIDPDHLAQLFAERYWKEPDRGYGRGAHLLLGDLVRGRPWRMAAQALGCGRKVICSDTVPFALWCAACCARDFAEALWTLVSVGGDVDTNSAIVGSIVVLSAGPSCLPPRWLDATEKLPGQS
jgi:ADP-ribosylglycohydrolase